MFGRAFKIVNSTASHNFPELSKASIVLRCALTVFDYLYAAVKPFLAAALCAAYKVKVFSDPKLQYEALQKLLEDKDIPRLFGAGSEDLVPGDIAEFYRRRPVTNPVGEGYLPRATVKKQNEWINAQASSTKYAAATSPRSQRRQGECI